MAKKAVKKTARPVRRSESEDLSSIRSAGSRRSNSQSATMDRDYKDVLKDFISNPAVRYVAGGIATAVLARIATNLSDRYPELSNFIKENLENVEGRFGEFRSGMGGENARH